MSLDSFDSSLESVWETPATDTTLPSSTKDKKPTKAPMVDLDAAAWGSPVDDAKQQTLRDLNDQNFPTYDLDSSKTWDKISAGWHVTTGAALSLGQMATEFTTGTIAALGASLTGINQKDMTPEKWADSFEYVSQSLSAQLIV